MCVTSIDKEITRKKSLPLKPQGQLLPPRQYSNDYLCQKMTFRLAPWRLEEFMQTVEDDEFFESVKTAFAVKEVHLSSIGDRKDMVLSKFYVTGGSARAMFDMDDQGARDLISDRLKECFDIRAILKDALMSKHSFSGTVGECSNIVNRLFAHYGWDSEDGRVKFDQVVVSSYAMKLIAEKLGPDAYIEVARNLFLNPSMDGFLFEDWVIASLRQHAILYTFQQNRSILEEISDPAPAPSSTNNVGRELTKKEQQLCFDFHHQQQYCQWGMGAERKVAVGTSTPSDEYFAAVVGTAIIEVVKLTKTRG